MPVPTTWPALLADREGAENDAATIAELLPVMAEVPPGDAAPILGSTANPLCRASVVLGPERAVEAGAPLAKPAAAVAGIRKQLVHGPVAEEGVLAVVNALRCHGVRVSVTLADEAAWAADLAKQAKGDLARSEVRGTAFALLGTGGEKKVPSVAGGKLPKFAPGEAFGANLQGFLLYLAAGLAEGADEEAVRPAWEAFLDLFPRKLAAETLGWSDLAWAARVVNERFGGRSVKSTAEWLHAQVRGR